MFTDLKNGETPMPINPETQNPESQIQNREKTFQVKYKARLDKVKTVCEINEWIVNFTIPESDIMDEVLDTVINKKRIYEFFAESVILAIARFNNNLYVLAYTEIPGFENSASLGLWKIPLEVDEE